jgi:hypothetical protein
MVNDWLPPRRAILGRLARFGRLARQLLKVDDWEFQRPSLKQAPPGQDISSPAAFLFRTVEQ